MAEIISSRENQKIKYACKLQQSQGFRIKEGLFFAESPKLCLELAKGCHAKTVYYTQKAKASWPELETLGEQQFFISESVSEKLAGMPSPQGVFAIFELPDTSLDKIKPKGRYLCLDAVQDPGNVGALIRSAAAFGFDGVICTKSCASVFGIKTLRASMGAIARISVIIVEDMQETLAFLKEKNVFTIAAAVYESVALQDIDSPPEKGLAIVIGNEGQGLPQKVIATCDVSVRIPICNQVESLNAAAAGTVLAWHFRNKEML